MLAWDPTACRTARRLALIALGRSLFAEHGKLTLRVWLDSGHPGSQPLFDQLFGSWGEFRVLCGAGACRKPRWSDEQLLQVARSLAERYGAVSRSVWEVEVKQGSLPALSTVRLRFGSLRGLAKRAGVAYQGRGEATNEQLIEHGSKLVALHGKLTQGIWAASNPPVDGFPARRFGDRDRFARLCGELPMRERVLDFCLTRYGSGARVPSSDTWNVTEGHPCSHGTVFNLFGSWHELRAEVDRTAHQLRGAAAVLVWELQAA